jgi:hypothetical protein
MNRGNAGQRYAMTKLVSVEVVGNHCISHVACGHDYSQEPMWVTVEELAVILRKRVGKRQRCNKCQSRLEAKP